MAGFRVAGRTLQEGAKAVQAPPPPPHPCHQAFAGACPPVRNTQAGWDSEVFSMSARLQLGDVNTEAMRPVDVRKASPGLAQCLPHPLRLDDLRGPPGPCHLWVPWVFNVEEMLTQVLGLSGEAGALNALPTPGSLAVVVERCLGPLEPRDLGLTGL